MTTTKYTLTITYCQAHHVTQWDDPTPSAMESTISADVTDASVHQWFSLFQNILSLAGHSERTIMTGACRLAFNEWRPADEMRRLVREFELEEFMTSTPTCDEQSS